jgi:hypothetical protein
LLDLPIQDNQVNLHEYVVSHYLDEVQ